MENRQKNNTTQRSIFDKISEKLFNLLKNGMFGYFFTSYDNANESYQRKIKRKKAVHATGKARRGVSRLIERSFLVNLFPKIADFLLRVSLRDYGLMLLTMGIVSSILYPLRERILLFNIPLELFVAGIVISVCAIPLLFSAKSLSSNLYSSKWCNKLLFSLCGFDHERMREVSEKQRFSYPNIAFFTGLAFGILSYFVPPLKIIGIVALITLAYSTLRAPEIGAIAILVALPFVNAITMSICVLFVFACYMIKFIIGKRTFKFEYFDVWVLLVAVYYTIRAFISTDIASSVKESAICVSMMLAYFLYINLIRSKEWFRRCVAALISAGTIVAILAIFQAIVGKLNTYFPDIFTTFKEGQSVFATFGSSETLGHFIVLLLPFTVVHMFSERKGAKKFLGFVLCVVLLAAMVLTDSLSAVIGVISAILLLLIFYGRNNIYLALIVGAAFPILYLTLPEDILNRILSIDMLKDVSFAEIVNEIRHSLQLFMSKPFGVGMGEQAFVNAFGPEAKPAKTMIVQLFVEHGIIGMIIFAVFFAMLMRFVFSYCVKAKNRYRKINCCSSFCSIVGFANAGLISYTLYDKRLFLLIWIFVALMVSYIRIERDDEEPKKIAPRVTSADLEIVLTKENDQNDVPRRKYVRVPRVKGKDFEDEDEIAKEFDEELDEEPVKKDKSENKPIEIPFKVEEIENEGGDELKNEEE